MATSSLFTLGPVIAQSGQINQITQQQIDPGVETVLLCADGQVDYTFAAAMFLKPMLSFSSSAIALALGYAGIGGLAASSVTDPATSPLDMWFQKMQQGGTRLTGNNSTRFRATDGLLVPKRLTASQGSVASIDYEMAAISPDGTTAPLAVTPNSTMPAVLSTRQEFTVGPATINGTSIEVDSITIDFGMDLIIHANNGELYPTFVAIQKRKPSLSLKTTNVNIIDTFGGFYVAQGATDTVFWLRKLAQNGGRVANNVAEHVKGSIDDGIITIKPVGNDESRPSELEIMIEPTWDGTNAVVAWTTGAAIT